MDIDALLKCMIEKNASDLFLTPSLSPSIKVNGDIQFLEQEKLTAKQIRMTAQTILSEQQLDQFEKTHEMNLAISKPGLGRFRLSFFIQRSEIACVIRAIKTDIPTLEELKLPALLSKLIMEKRGLIIIVGATGSGKSTTLASMINFRNQNKTGHIISVEEPIEFIHKHQQSIVNQREIGIDTDSYEIALKNALRQAPDVILIGEVRSQDIMEHALRFTETGHLCLTTLHARNACQALERIINLFPEERHKQLCADLSSNLNAIISQRLVRNVNGGRIVATEILLASELVKDMIKTGNISEIRDVMQRSENQGMQTFDSTLYDLYQQNEILEAEALANAESPNNLRLKISLASGSNKESSNLSLQKESDYRFGNH